MITVLISDWLRQVISTKARRRRKVAQVTACGDCGDFHARRSDVCRVRELRVKMLVQQIMGTSKDIKVCNCVVVAAFNQEKALVGAFSVIVKTDCETDGALHSTKFLSSCVVFTGYKWAPL